jgi:hypothetical protein
MAATAGAYHFSGGRGGYDQDDDDRPQQNAAGTFKVPDKDFYRCISTVIKYLSLLINCLYF